MTPVLVIYAAGILAMLAWIVPIVLRSFEPVPSPANQLPPGVVALLAVMITMAFAIFWPLTLAAAIATKVKRSGE